MTGTLVTDFPTTSNQTYFLRLNRRGRWVIWIGGLPLRATSFRLLREAKAGAAILQDRWPAPIVVERNDSRARKAPVSTDVTPAASPLPHHKGGNTPKTSKTPMPYKLAP